MYCDDMTLDEAWAWLRETTDEWDAEDLAARIRELEGGN